MVRVSSAVALATLFVLVAPASAQKSQEKGTTPVGFDTPSTFIGEIEVQGPTGRVNVRLKPGTGEEIPVTDILKDGAKVHVIGKEGNWYAIVPPKGSVGCWIHSSNVKVEGERATVVTDQAPVRFDSRQNADVLAKLPKGTEVHIHKSHLGWHQITEPPGVQYYVYAKYVKATGTAVDHPGNVTAKTSSSVIQQLVEEAQADTFAAMGSPTLDFTRAISKWRKAHDLAVAEKNDAMVADTLRQLQFTTSIHQICLANRENGTEMANLQDQIKRMQAQTQLQIKAAVEAAKPPKAVYTHHGFLETTPYTLSHNGMFCLYDRLDVGKRVCFIKVDEISKTRLYNRYRQYIKINGTKSGSEDGIDIIQLGDVSDSHPTEFSAGK